jgi:serine protease Do
MRDLPRIVADTPVGKAVDVTIIRKGKEEKKSVTLGRLDDTDKKQASLTRKDDDPPEAKTTVTKTLGLGLAGLTDDLRKRYKIKDKVKGVVITEIENGSAASEKRLQPGMVIVELQQQAVSTAADFKTRVEKLKKDGKKAAVLLVSNPDGDTTFVALSLQ